MSQLFHHNIVSYQHGLPFLIVVRGSRYANLQSFLCYSEQDM